MEGSRFGHFLIFIQNISLEDHSERTAVGPHHTTSFTPGPGKQDRARTNRFYRHTTPGHPFFRQADQ